MSIKISALPLTTTVSSTDFLVVDKGTPPVTYKVPVSAVQGNITSLASSDGSSHIGFIQEGTGAVARTVQDKAREWISVKDYGAVGDGTTADQAAIQVAFTAAQAIATARGSCGIHFPPGTYKVVDGLTIKGDNITIHGYGASLKYSASLPAVPPAAASAPCILMRGNSCGIYGLRIYCEGTQTRLSAGIAIQCGYGVLESTNTHTKGLIIQDCIIDNIGCAGIWVNNVGNAMVSNCVVQYCKADGIHFSDGCYGIACVGNVVSYCEDDYISVLNDYKTDVPDLLVGSFSITGNTIVGAVGLWGAGITIGCAHYGVISGNSIQDTVGPGIAMYNTGGETTPTTWTSNITITGNAFSNCGVTTTATAGYVPGTNNGHPGTMFIGVGIYAGACYKLTISGNTFCNMQFDSTNSGAGEGGLTYSLGVIRCEALYDAQIVNNTFYDNACSNIVLKYDNVDPYTTIAHNTFGQCSRYNVYVLSSVGHYPKHTIRYNAFYQTATLGDLYLDSIDSTLLLEYSGTSTNNWIRTGNRPYKSRFLYYNGSVQAVTSASYQVLDTPTRIYDDNYLFSALPGDFTYTTTGTSKFTAPRTGKYVFIGGVFLTYAAVGDGGISIYVDGALASVLSYLANGGTLVAWTSSGQQSGATPPLSLTAGQVVTLRVYSSTNINTSPGQAYVYFGGYEL